MLKKKSRTWFLEQLDKVLEVGSCGDRRWLDGERTRMRTDVDRVPSHGAVERLRRAMRRVGLLPKAPAKTWGRRPLHFGTAYEADPTFVPDWARDPSLLPKRPPVYRQAAAR